MTKSALRLCLQGHREPHNPLIITTPLFPRTPLTHTNNINKTILMTNFHYRVKAQQLHPNILAIALIAPRVRSADHTTTSLLRLRMYIAMAKLLLQANLTQVAPIPTMTPTIFRACVAPEHGEASNILSRDMKLLRLAINTKEEEHPDDLVACIIDQAKNIIRTR